MSDRYVFDQAAAAAAIAWVERYCVFTEDKWAGRPFRLEPWQAAIIRDLFGWKVSTTGLRRYKRALIWVPRKNGKSELAAAVSLLVLVATGTVGGQVYSLGRDLDQARIVFEKASRMVRWSPALARAIEPLKTSLFCPQLVASYRPLSGVPAGKHGMSATGIIGDEAHEWRDGRLYAYVHQSEGNRAEPIELIISTAGVMDGYGYELWQETLRIRDGLIEDPETLVVIYAADPEDDWTDPKVWAKANPNLGVSLRPDYLETECRRAQESPERENDFKRYHLNLWTEQATRWVPIAHWDRAGGADKDRWRRLAEELEGRRCYGGLDLAATTDFNALVWVFPDEDDPDAAPIVLPRFWIPEATMALRKRRDRIPVDQWRRDGALIATPGNVADYAAIKNQIFEDAERFQVEGLAIDRWNATQISVELAAEGIAIELFGQGFGSMSAPAKRFETLVTDGRLDHGHHPVLRWMVGNVAVERNSTDDIKPVKTSPVHRIDGVVATIMGLGLMMKAERKIVEIEYRAGDIFL